MYFFDLRILITPLVSSNSSQNNHIIYTKETIVERMVGEGGGRFIRCNKQQSQFPLKRIMKLVIGYRLTIFRPLSTQSLFYYLHLDLTCHYTNVHPYYTFNNIAVIQLYNGCQLLIGRGSRDTRSALIPDTLLLSQALQVHLAMGTNRMHQS